MNGCAREGNTRNNQGRCSRSRVGTSISEHAVQEKTTQDATIDEIANQGLAGQLESELWRQSLIDHDVLLSICEKSRIELHSCHPENSLDAEDKAAHSTPLIR